MVGQTFSFSLIVQQVLTSDDLSVAPTEILEAYQKLSIYLRAEPQVSYNLSDREIQVLKLVAQGYANKEIATDLDISLQTVKNHISSCLAKLGVEDRTQAALLALVSGMVSFSDVASRLAGVQASFVSAPTSTHEGLASGSVYGRAFDS